MQTLTEESEKVKLDLSPWKPPSLISLTGLLGSGSVAVAHISAAFSSHGLCDGDEVLLPPGPTCWCSSCTGVKALERGALWGSGGLWGALCGMGRVMPWEEPLVGEIWLSDITVEGMRLGERLDVLAARRRELCWAEPLDVVEVDAAGLALPLTLLSGRGLTEALRGVLVWWGDAPCDEPPAAPPVDDTERKVCGEPWGAQVSLWEEEGSERCCWERLESPFNRGGTSWTESLWKNKYRYY